MIVRLLQGLLLVILLASNPLARVLPARWGWENGVFENLQVAVLLGGLVFAAAVYRRHRKAPQGWLALCVLPLWAILIARELSWGAVFLTPLDMSSAGPSFSSRMLWYKPIVYPVVVLLVAGSAYIAAKYRADRAFSQAVARGGLPLFEPLVLTAALYVSTCADGHVSCALELVPGRQELLEELAELVAYMALWLAQLRILSDRPPLPMRF